MIEILEETGSTNADLLGRLAGGGAVSEGLWLIARRQTAGRGRTGREWFDGAGNFMGSTAVHCRAADPAPSTLALVAGLALHDLCAKIAPNAGLRLKWPNDLMADGAKVAGILLERQGDWVVVGVGVNLAVPPPLRDRKAAALWQFGSSRNGSPPDPGDFAQALAESFGTELARWRSAGLPPILRRWQAAAHPVGSPLVSHDAGNESVRGTFAGLADDGGLQLRLPDGTTRIIRSGEVFPDTGPGGRTGA